MYYISSKKNNLYGITDSKDDIEEFYDTKFIFDNFKDINIKGVYRNGSNFRISVWNPVKEALKYKMACSDFEIEIDKIV